MDKKYEEFQLGEDERCRFSTDCNITGLNNNVLGVGGSGTGKTMSLMMPMIYNLENSNAIVVHTKKGIYEKTKAVLEKKGYNIIQIDLNEPANSAYGYDPLLQCKTLNDVRDLAHSIAYCEHTGDAPPREPFWPQNAEKLIYLVLRYVFEGHYEKGRSMKEALYLLDYLCYTDDFDVKSDPPIDDEIADYEECERECAHLRGTKHKWKNSVSESQRKRWEQINKNYPLHGEMRNWYYIDRATYIQWKQFLDMSEQTGSSVVGQTTAPLNLMFNSDVRKIVGTDLPQFEIKEFLKPKTIAFISVSPVNMAQHRFISIFYKQIFKDLFELGEKQPNGVLPHHVHVLCDDFATGCKVADFQDLISIFREKGISATMLVQSETQLSQMYGMESAQTIINNCDTYVYMGGMDLYTAANISKRVNHPLDKVLTMPLGQEYFFRRGQKPVITQRYNILRDIKAMEKYNVEYTHAI